MSYPEKIKESLPGTAGRDTEAPVYSRRSGSSTAHRLPILKLSSLQAQT